MKNRSCILPAIVALAGLLPQSKAALNLGSADGFAVLGSSTVVSAGNTIVTGNLGVFPGTAISGFTFSPIPGPGIVNGTSYAGGPFAQQAQADALTAYGTLAGETFTQNLTGQGLGSRTLGPGVYHFDAGAQLTGILILDAGGDPTRRFDFLIGSTLGTAGGSSVSLINGAQAGNVFWQVGSSATLGSDTAFYGSILADQSITMNSGASLSGRALALNAAVTLNGNAITVVPEPAAFWLLAFCAAIFAAWPRLIGWRRKAGRS